MCVCDVLPTATPSEEKVVIHQMLCLALIPLVSRDFRDMPVPCFLRWPSQPKLQGDRFSNIEISFLKHISQTNIDPNTQSRPPTTLPSVSLGVVVRGRRPLGATRGRLIGTNWVTPEKLSD